MHMRRTNFPSCSSTMVNAVSDNLASLFVGNPCSCLHACSQERQPMHLVMSTRMALVFSISDLLDRNLGENSPRLDGLFGFAQGRPGGRRYVTWLRKNSP